MGDSLIGRSLGTLFSPQKTFLEAAERPNERHVIILSLLFGFLFARQIIRSENRDLFFYVTTALASGVGFVYFAGFFMAALIKMTGPFAHPEKMRMVMAYSLVPYIISLALLLLSKTMALPQGVGVVSFFLSLASWVLAVSGVKTVGKVKVTQALLVVVLPVAALLLVIALLFKAAWMLEG